mgnify:CR=1 FL=1
MRALDIAATGMQAQQTRVETISNNLANMSTTAYNPRRAEFADLHYQQVRQPGSINASNGAVLPTGVQLGLGVRTAAVSMDVTQGGLRQTDGELDVAIEGGGLIEIELPNGASAYTRDGALKRTGDGLLVTSEGHPVIPAITIPEDARSISISADGEVVARPERVEIVSDFEFVDLAVLSQHLPTAIHIHRRVVCPIPVPLRQPGT